MNWIGLKGKSNSMINFEGPCAYDKIQTFKEDLDQHLNDLFVLHSIGLDEHKGQGNAFYIRKEFI